MDTKKMNPANAAAPNHIIQRLLLDPLRDEELPRLNRVTGFMGAAWMFLWFLLWEFRSPQNVTRSPHCRAATTVQCYVREETHGTQQKGAEKCQKKQAAATHK